MKLGIIQLSDIHFNSLEDFVLDKKNLFIDACCSELTDCSKIVLVITGDISFSGDTDQYDIAYEFFKEIEHQIRERSTYINSFQYVIVPGNHDCNFKDDSIRDIVIDRILLTNTKIDDNIIAKCLEPQKNFWNFLSRITGTNYEPCISYKVEVRLTLDENIVFHCYNSSFLSTLNEKIGSLIIPKEKYLYRDGTKEKVVISLFHHNTGWLSPGNTQENPKKMFESHLIDVSDIVMCGHEHSLKQQVVTSLEKKENIIYLEGGAFQYNDISEFGILKYDTSTKKIGAD